MSDSINWIGIDHIVLTVKNIDHSVRFYSDVLGATPIVFGDQRKAVRLGQSKINFHLSTHPINPHAKQPIVGSADFCLISSCPLALIQKRLKQFNVPIELGPVEREIAIGRALSLYIRDPDGNLIEISLPIKC